MTGAGGFVGANLVRGLLRAGHQVTAIVRPGPVPWRLAAVQDDARLVALDLTDHERLRAAVSTTRADWVFHLAAHGAYSWQVDASTIMETNVLATVALVEACRDTGCEAFVHAGSSSEYGFKDHAPDEHEPLEPNSAYAVAKASATLYCRHMGRTGALNAVTTRFYSVYGPYEDPRRLIPTLIVRGLRGELPPLVDPDVARDFVASDDAVDALLLAAAHAGEVPGAVYNIGSGKQTAIRELVELARRILQIDAAPVWGSQPERSWDTTTWVADPRRATRQLGWRAKLDLEAGFARTLDWLRSAPEAREAYGVEA